MAQPIFKKDGFATLHNVDYLYKEPLNSSFLASLEGLDTRHKSNASEILYRAHLCSWAYNQTKDLSGDILSFGVHFGILEKTIAEHHNANDADTSAKKLFYLFDTWGEFAGGHEDYVVDIFPIVRERFKKYDFVRFVRGLVPDSFKELKIPAVSFLLIDLNGWAAELAVLEEFYSKVQPGGVIYFDDYGWNYPELRAVVDKFLENKPETLLNFASGNSILVKK
jgi:SAM-dependent methyltransferase